MLCATGSGDPLLVVGGASGALTVWNLETQRLQTLVPAAHGGAVTSLHFFAGEPRLLSSGADNRCDIAPISLHTSV